MTDTLLQIRNLRVEADSPGEPGKILTLVDDVSFELEKGKVIGFIGESGAGKSTVGLAALGFGRGGCRIVGGEILLDGENILQLSDEKIRRLRGRRIAYVAQSAAAAFNPAHRIGDQVIECMVTHRVADGEEAANRAVELFGQLGLPDPSQFGRRFPHQVSGGQLQRAMTAMALCCRPDLVVFDEPTTALDVTTQIDVLAAIKQAVANAHAAAIYISHDLAVVVQIADDIMVLRHGKMVEHNTTADILHRPQEDYTRRLIAVRSIRKAESESESPLPPLLETENITAGYGDLAVLNQVSITLAKGKTLAVVGESGSGKSTLARVITGLLPQTGGRVIFDGNPLPPTLAARESDSLRDIQMIYQMPDVALNPRQTVRRIIGRAAEFYHGLKGKALENRASELIAQIELDDSFLDRLPGELSGGQKQRVCIARALAAKPRLIICDEITSALDPLVADDILRLLLRLQEAEGVSYLFITHDLATVKAIADSIAVMHQGKVVAFGAKKEVLTPPHDDYTHLLLSSVPEMKLGWLENVQQQRRMQAAGH